MMKNLSGIILKKENEEVFHLEIPSNYIFFNFINEASSCSFYLEESQINDQLLKLVEEAHLYLKCPPSQCKLKIISNSKNTPRITKLLNVGQYLEHKLAQRDTKYELYYYAKESRIRLSVEESISDKNIPTPSRKTKVLIVDDSKTIRTLLSKIFSEDPEFEIVGTAEHPAEVIPLIESKKPDVITLDINLPEMDGVELLKKYYPIYQIPTVLITSISMEEGPKVLDALENGAVDYIQKPSASDMQEAKIVIIEKIKIAAKSRKTISIVTSTPKPANRPIFNQKIKYAAESLIVVGSSTGGTNALKDILTALPAEIPPILIVQHIPPVFSAAFANRLNQLCPFTVKEAQDGELVEPNTVYVAPGGFHMTIKKQGDITRIKILDTDPVNRFKPSVDVLFESVSKNMWKNTVALMLTGMGSDGSKQMKKLKDLGAKTIAQNEETCIVFGMPREAIALKCVDAIEPLGNIHNKLIEFSTKKESKQAAS